MATKALGPTRTQPAPHAMDGVLVVAATTVTDVLVTHAALGIEVLDWTLLRTHPAPHTGPGTVVVAETVVG